MVKRKSVAAKPTVTEEPQPPKEEPIVTLVSPAPAVDVKSALKVIVAELEADPLVPMDCEYPREYGEKIFPRYQKFFAQLKKLAE